MIAYNPTWLRNVGITKEAKAWSEHEIISADQYAMIKTSYPSNFYHPNLIIRILLFIATLVALAGATGLFALIFSGIIFEGDGAPIMFTIYGIASWVILELFFIKQKHHYKSGVTEGLLYHSAGFVVGGLAGTTNFDEHFSLVLILIVSAVAIVRYADLIATVFFIGSFAGIIFLEMYKIGGVAQHLIPFAFIIVFTTAFLVVRKFKEKRALTHWTDCMTLTEVLCLLLVYAAGNYLVVRELSVSMLDLYIEDGQDIPFAFIFYALTVIIPLTYLFFGIRNKDIILLRVSLLVLAFSVFTFKYYFSLGHPEITLTLAGIIMITVAFGLFRYLRAPKRGFTRENLLGEKWAGANPEAFVISQTLGGNKMPEGAQVGGGGQSSGGGSSDAW
jgi:hypothetical protein